MAYYAEHPTNREFATVGDALWWGIVTLTTVGYGDIVPQWSTEPSPHLAFRPGRGQPSRTVRSVAAKASGLPMPPYSPPRNPS